MNEAIYPNLGIKVFLIRGTVERPCTNFELMAMAFNPMTDKLVFTSNCLVNIRDNQNELIAPYSKRFIVSQLGAGSVIDILNNFISSIIVDIEKIKEEHKFLS